MRRTERPQIVPRMLPLQSMLLEVTRLEACTQTSDSDLVQRKQLEERITYLEQVFLKFKLVF